MMKDDKPNKVEEPAVAYQPTVKKTITVYSSFEQMEIDRFKLLASSSYEKCLSIFSQNRRLRFKNILLSDNTFPPFKKVIKSNRLPYEF